MGKCAAAHLMENAAKVLGELPYKYVCLIKLRILLTLFA
jgi:hypothetical protein